MLETLHLAPALTLGLTPIYETFPTSHQYSYVAAYFPPDPSALPLLSRTFSPFWPRPQQGRKKKEDRSEGMLQWMGSG